MADIAKFVSRALALVALSAPVLALAQYSASKIGYVYNYAGAAANGGIFCGSSRGAELYLPAQGWVGLPASLGLDTAYAYYGYNTGISHDGTVISGYTDGEVSNGVYVQYAAYWVNQQEYLVPAPPDDPTPNNMTASAVSGDGSTLLVEDATSAHTESYIYNIASGTFTPLGYFGTATQQTFVTTCSNNGSIVAGYSDRDDNTIHGFIWTAATGMTDIGMPPQYPNTFYVEPRCMSDDGSVLYGSYTYGGGWEGFRYTASTGFLDLNGIVPSACTADGSEVVGTENLYFPAIWTTTLGGGYVDHLLSANGISSTIGDYSAPFTLAPNGLDMSALGIFGYNGEGAPQYGTVQIDLPFPLATVAIADGGYYTATYATALSVTAPGVTGPGCSEFGEGSSAVLVKGPLYASAFKLNSDGSFSYTPSSAAAGQTDTFTYKLQNASGTSNSAKVQIAVGAHITSVSPSSIAAGSSNTTVTLSGAGFNPGDQILLNTSVALSTTYVSATQLQAVIPASYLMSAGTLSLNDNGTSNSVTVTVTTTNSGPTLSKLVIPSPLYDDASYTCQVQLTGPAPATGAVVLLRTSNPLIASVPPSVKVAAGQTSANFTLTCHHVAANANLTVSATYGKSSLTQSITIQP